MLKHIIHGNQWDNLGNAKAALDLFYERNSQKPPDDVH